MKETGPLESIMRRLYTLTYFVSLVPMKLYDILKGTEFSGIEKTDEADGRFSYFPSPVFSFPGLAGYIRKRMQNGEGHSVLDIGCGKGLMLLFLCGRRFDRVAGIDFDAELCRRARANLRKASAAAGVIEADAVAFTQYEDYDTFYLYNPFDGEILEKCVERIISSLRTAPRMLTVFYCNPVYGDILKKKGFREEGHFYYKTAVFVLRENEGRNE